MSDPKRNEDQEIADASFLFRDEPRRPAGREPSRQADPPAASSEDYAVEEPTPVARPSRPRATFSIDDAGSSPRDRARAAETGALGEGISRNWSRGQEWGPDLLRVAVLIGIVIAVLVLTFDLGALGTWFSLMAVGGVVVLVALYPIMITLERPVRVTPEQAIKDYYDSLNHLLPHYRRMWLLLSDQGKADFSGFPEFKSYWSKRVAGWKQKSGKTGVTNPISVTVESFKSGSKSAGLARIEADFSLRVLTRVDDRPVFQCDVTKAVLIKGTDRMWYLTNGKPPGN